MTRFAQTLAVSALLSALLWAGCTSDSGPGTTTIAPDSSATPPADSGGIGGLPSPLQMMLLLMNADAPFNSELLNPHTKAETYPNSYKQAINLGVYQADLGYIIAHQQTQAALNYFGSVKKLGDKLGIFGAFENGMMERAEKNLGNKDSLMGISSSAFTDASEYLDENKRPADADLIAVGGWVESTYLATQTLKTHDNALLRRRIGQDKLLLPKLIALVQAHPADADHQALLAKLNDLQSAYEHVKVETDYRAAVTDTVRKVTRIGSKTKVRYKKEDLARITDKIAALRKDFVQ
jgi:hypothetical protein